MYFIRGTTNSVGGSWCKFWSSGKGSVADAEMVVGQEMQGQAVYRHVLDSRAQVETEQHHSQTHHVIWGHGRT
ncbi:hypothetical protein E2C01_040145 [Portunus trituberculatus]|uniref:Uncharacterized protein n=1 Tax=Portunus trituberculatus TaxID=210409 RepID=A0A5B7FLS3_PORTR|nr:hypothetical protein [Portunus trituberculatus]